LRPKEFRLSLIPVRLRPSSSFHIIFKASETSHYSPCYFAIPVLLAVFSVTVLLAVAMLYVMLFSCFGSAYGADFHKLD